MPGVCLRLIFLRVMFLKNKSSLLQREQEKMLFAHPNKTEQLHSDDLVPLQFGIKTCQYCQEGHSLRAKVTCPVPALPLPPAAACRYPTAIVPVLGTQSSVVFA